MEINETSIEGGSAAHGPTLRRGEWRQVEIPQRGTRWAWVPAEERPWTRDMVGELAEYAGWWLRARAASPRTREAYARDVGLSYVLAAVDRGGELVEHTARRTGVRLPIGEPGPRAARWHQTVLPWLAARGIDPWGPRVCEHIGQWGEEIADQDMPDHVWTTDGAPRPLASATVRRRAAATRSYYAWHHAAGLTVCAPAETWTPKAAGIPPQPRFRAPSLDLDRDDLARLQVAADEHVGADGEREFLAALVAVLCCTAVRSVELSRLDLGDYLRSSRRGPMLHIRGKGAVERHVGLDEVATDRVDRWLAWRPDLAYLGAGVHARLRAARALPHRVPLFVPARTARRGVWTVRQQQEGHVGRMAPRVVWEQLRRLCRRAASPVVRELAEHIHPHAIRGEVASDLIDQGWQLADVANLLGHGSITTTARYDRRQRDRHIPAASVAARRQATAIEEQQRLAITGGQ